MDARTVAIIGGGASGRAIAAAAERRGATPRLLSRTTGFDVLRDDVAAAVDGAVAVVEATGRFTTGRRRATAFFTGSTRAVAAATNRTGARHVLLSIARCTLPEVQGYGYFAGKTAQESVARAESRHLRIVRSTQWHEFAGQNVERLRLGPVLLVPSMTIRPVALDTAADAVVAAALDPDHPEVVEVAGPGTTTLWDMTRALAPDRVVPVPLRLPGRTGAAFTGGALVPGAEVEGRGPSFDAWLAAR